MGLRVSLKRRWLGCRALQGIGVGLTFSQLLNHLISPPLSHISHSLTVLALSLYEDEGRESKGHYLARMLTRWIFTLIFSAFAALMISAQAIEFGNGSFEGEPRDATVPQGWMPCMVGTTPDILPGYWGVYTDPSDGDTYVGLITRENNTWESISQRLQGRLKKGVCYSFSLDLAHSDTYSGYTGPLRLRIYTSKLKCKKDQLIFESPLIEHLDWKTYKVKFTPDDDHQYIHIEAYHDQKPVHYKGNILIDRMRAIVPCDRT